MARPHANRHEPAPGADLEDAALTEEALAELDAGVGIPLAEVKAWVESWGTEAELPAPEARKLR